MDQPRASNASLGGFFRHHLASIGHSSFPCQRWSRSDTCKSSYYFVRQKQGKEKQIVQESCRSYSWSLRCRKSSCLIKQTKKTILNQFEGIAQSSEHDNKRNIGSLTIPFVL